MTDLAAMWSNALDEYYKSAGLNPRTMPKYNSMNDIMGDQEIQQNFAKVRSYPEYTADAVSNKCYK